MKCISLIIFHNFNFYLFIFPQKLIYFTQQLQRPHMASPDEEDSISDDSQDSMSDFNSYDDNDDTSEPEFPEIQDPGWK